MRITCFITVCAYLSSTVSTDEIKFSNRVKKARPQEELALEETVARKVVTPVTVYPDDIVKYRPKVRIETQNPRKSREPQFAGAVSQQLRHYGRSDHTTKRALKRLKTRSVAEELKDNQLNELTKPIRQVHDSVHIEPMLRVTTTHNVFDSIMDILHQLMEPPKNKPGPLVGPIRMPGSKRKIYLRLLEPVDSSHVMVRFVTQMPVPVIDADSKHATFLHGSSPIIDPAAFLLNGHHGRYNSVGDAVFDASNRHNSIRPPRNASRVAGKAVQGGPFAKPSSLPKMPNSLIGDHRDIGTSDKGDFSPDKVAAPSRTTAENNGGSVVTAVDDVPRLNPQSYEDSTSRFPAGKSAGTYRYRYQTNEEHAATERPKGSINGTVSNVVHDDSKESLPPPWYHHQLSTHRLPLRQIAPLYPLSSAMTGEFVPDSYANAYKEATLNGDVLVVPDLYETSSYERFNKDNIPVPELHVGPYDPRHAAAPIPYPTTLRDVAISPFSPYQKQSEFVDSPLYAHAGYEKPSDDLFAASSLRTTSFYREPAADVAPTLRTTSFYREPAADVAPTLRTTIHDKQTNDQVVSASFNDALRLVNPPDFSAAFSPHDQSSKNHAVPFAGTVRQPRYSARSHFNEMSLNVKPSVDDSLLQQTIWGKKKSEENSEPNLRQDASYSDDVGNRERWHPLMYVDEKGIWQEGEANLFADLTKTAGRREAYRSRKTAAAKPSRAPANSIAEGDDRRRNNTGKRRDADPPASVARATACSSTSDGESMRCEERTKSSTTPRAIVDQRSSASSIESIVTATTSMARASSTRGTPEATTTRSSTMMNIIVTERPLSLPLSGTTEGHAASSTTERSSPSTKMIVATTAQNDITERPIANVTKGTSGRKGARPTSDTTTGNTTDGTTMKSTTRRMPASGDNAKRLADASTLPKRPMLMKKPAFLMKRTESAGTTRKPLTSGNATTTTTTRKSMFRGADSTKKKTSGRRSN